MAEVRQVFSNNKQPFLEPHSLQLKGLDDYQFAVLGKILFSIQFGISPKPIYLPFHVSEGLSITGGLLLGFPEICAADLTWRPRDGYAEFDWCKIPVLDNFQSLLSQTDGESMRHQ